MTTNTSDRLKVGVVGLGKMGVMHACLLNVLPNVKLSGLCDRSRFMTTIAKHIFRGIAVTDNLDKFEDLDLDAIYVLTPIPSHYSIVKEIFDRNIASNLFVEKTLASSHRQSEELLRLAEKHKGINMVGYMKRYAVTFNKAKSFLDQQILGGLASFDAYAFSSDLADVPIGSSVSKARGGVLEDLGSHLADLSLWFFGDLDVTAAKISSRITQDSEDSVSFEVAGTGDLRGRFEVSWCRSGYHMPEFGLSIRGANGSLMVTDDEVRLELNGAQTRRWFRQDLDDNVGYLLGGPEYYREDEHFVKSIASKTKPESDFNSATKVDCLLNEVRCKAVDA